MTPTRRLTIVAQDPAVRVHGAILRCQVEAPQEPLLGGPRGHRIAVIDYDATRGQLHRPCKIPHGKDHYGGAPDELLLADYRFHAQNVYAILMRTLARFERALGRRVEWAFGSHQLHVAPHAFQGANAYYSPRDRGIVFGSFEGRHGTVHTSLSHDVVAHEGAHAALDGLRPRYLDASSPDQAAFHEGFADIVALLSVFSLPGVVASLLGPARLEKEELAAGKLREAVFFGLAQQMGEEISRVRGQALRRSITLPGSSAWRRDPEFAEPHRRGEPLVAAVMNAFLDIWLRRIEKMGTQTFLRDRVAEEGTAIADELLTLCIRAIDYMPPTDIHFRDFVSAALTGEREMQPADRGYPLLKALRRSFYRYGIPAASLRQGGIWEKPDGPIDYRGTHFEALQRDPDEVFRFLWDNRRSLGLYEDADTEVQSVRPAVRVGADGFVLRETVAEYVQRIRLEASELKRLRIRRPEGMARNQEVTLYGGGAMIFDEFGRLKYHVRNRIDNAERQSARLRHLFSSGEEVSIAEIHRKRRMV